MHLRNLDSSSLADTIEQTLSLATSCDGPSALGNATVRPRDILLTTHMANCYCYLAVWLCLQSLPPGIRHSGRDARVILR